jgi:hypothetical protein
MGVSGRGQARPLKAFGTPTSSAKKRKTKKAADDDDESDGEDHMTVSEDETPSKQSKVRKTATAKTPRSGRSGNFKGTGNRLGDSLGDGEDEGEEAEDDDFGFGGASGTGTRIKNEPIDDPFSSNGFFAKDLAEARRLRDMASSTSNGAGYLGLGLSDPYNNAASFSSGSAAGSGMNQSHFSGYTSSPGAMDGGNDALFSSSYNSFGTGGGMQGINPMTAMNDMSAQMAGLGGRVGMGMGMGGGMGMGLPTSMNNTTFPTNTGLSPHTSRMQLSSSPALNSTPIPFAAPPKRGAVTSSPASSAAARTPSKSATPSAAIPGRARSARQVSQQSAEKIAAYIQAEKEQDKANGEASSVEDSAASEFEGSDGDDIMI